MNYSNIYKAIIKIFQDCKVFSFPLDCRELLEHYGYQCLPYSRLSTAKRELCMNYSEDAFLFRNVLYYNDAILPNRQRFSFMHELGHIALEHVEYPVACREQEANAFASHILAPRIVIHHTGCQNEYDISCMFQLTAEASHYAYKDYKRWLRWRTYYESLEEAIFRHFYDSNLDCFVWNRKTCVHTGELCINRKEGCTVCEHAPIHSPQKNTSLKSPGGKVSSKYMDPIFLPDGFSRAENFYLYGDMY